MSYAIEDGDYIVLNDKFVGLKFVASPLIAGTYYRFKVKARNSLGYGAYSEELNIQAATMPAAPAQPTVNFISDNVEISWVAPYNRGDPIQGYKVLIQGSTGDFLEELVYCDGSDATVISNTACTIPST